MPKRRNREDYAYKSARERDGEGPRLPRKQQTMLDNYMSSDKRRKKVRNLQEKAYKRRKANA